MDSQVAELTAGSFSRMLKRRLRGATAGGEVGKEFRARKSSGSSSIAATN